MKKLLFLFICLVSAFFTYSQTTTGTLMHDGLTRDYILFVPSSYSSSQPTPLVINMHGYTSDANAQMLYTDFNSDADTAGYIVVYPNGVNNAWNSGFNFPYESGVDDVGFISKLIDKLSSEYNVDECRVYATGMSNGGFMSYRLACELYDKIAAIASVTGSMTAGMLTHCNTTRPISVMEIHGTADSIVLYNGSLGVTSVEDNLAFWANKNPCFGSVTSQDLPDVVNDNTTITKLSYPNCADGTELVTFRVNGGGHSWPSSVVDIDVTTKDINANSEIIQFFNKHPRCTNTGLGEVSESKNILLSPNPVGNVLTMHADISGEFIVNIFDVSGKLISSEQYATSSRNIHVESLTPGYYSIQIIGGKETTFGKFVKD